MRKISLIIASLVLVGFAGGVLAQETELPGPGLTPDSPFYFLESFFEGVGTFFTFGDVAKAERYAKLAAERIAEAKAVIDKGKPEFAQRALERYEGHLNKALIRAEKAKNKGLEIEEVTDKVAEATGKHILVLEKVLEKVPEEAKEGIKKAKEVCMTGQKNALRFLARENPERAAEINLQTLGTRLDRARQKAERGEFEEVEEVMGEFENFQKFGEEISQIAQQVGKDVAKVEELVGKATSIHLEVLAEVYEKVPEEAKESIEKAMEVSAKGHQRAMKSLKKALEEAPETWEEVLEEIPEEAPLPETVPREVRERVKERVRQKIEEEKIKEELEEEIETEEEVKIEVPEVEKPEIEKPEVEKPEIEKMEIPLPQQ
jgi:tetratricopeptide (TPR) repeat protein